MEVTGPGCQGELGVELQMMFVKTSHADNHHNEFVSSSTWSLYDNFHLNLQQVRGATASAER